MMLEYPQTKIKFRHNSGSAWTVICNDDIKGEIKAQPGRFGYFFFPIVGKPVQFDYLSNLKQYVKERFRHQPG